MKAPQTVTERLTRTLASVTLAVMALSGPATGFAQSSSAETAPDLASFFAHSVPLNQTGAGSLSVTADVGGVETEFLLDTGASMVTVSANLFKEIQSRSSVIKVRRVGARLASGKVEVLDVYQVERFTLSDGCELGPVEVAVLKRGGRNLLGMNALQQAAPFAISMTPPSLGLSRCGFAPPQATQVTLRD